MRSFFYKLSCFIIFLSFSNTTYTQVGPPTGDVPITTLGTIVNDGDGMFLVGAYCLDENNDLIVSTEIILGGLWFNGQYGEIPSNYDPMYIEYTINGVVYPPIPLGSFTPVTLPNGTSAYSYIAESPAIDFSGDCSGTTFGENYLYTTVSYRLVTPNGNGWDIYPACNYTQGWGMFSCNVYPEAPWCESTATQGFGIPSGPSNPCYNEWFSGGFTAYMFCDCYDILPPRDEDQTIDSGDNFVNNGEDANNRFYLKDALAVYPNPMLNSLQIDVNSGFISHVEIYNARGEQVLANSYMSEAVQKITLDTENFPSGLYLTRITTNTGIKVIKVLK